jgi:dipeptidyl-peptidase 4
MHAHVAPRVLVAAIVAGLSASPAPALAQRPLTVDRLVATPALWGTPPAAPAWSPDSRHLAFLWNDRGGAARDLWVVERDDSTPRRLTPVAVDGRGSVAAFTWSGPASLLYLQAGDLWRIGLTAPNAERITSDGGGKSALGVSPDGRWISFLRDGDLWLLPAAGGTPERVTALGIPPLSPLPLGTYHAPDREVGDATWGGAAPPYAWSPDSRTIAVHVVDRRQVRRTGFPYYLGDTAFMHVLRRSFPGERNEERTVQLLDVATRRLTPVPLEGSGERRVVDFAWSPRGELLIDRESDDAIQRWIHLVTPGSVPREVWRDVRATRIYNDIASTWHPDGRRLVITGDLGDRYRLYVITPGDTVPRPLTPAESDVAGKAIANAATRALFYLSNDPSPYERHVWRVDDRGRRERLTTRAGHYSPVVAPDGRMAAWLHTDDVTPMELYLAAVVPGAPMRRVTHSPPPEFAAVPWIKARYVTFRHKSEPITLHARILEPPRMEPGRKYPVLFGPVYSNTVRNRWAGLYGAVQQLLALEHGYIVVQVDVRGSTGYGRDFREKFLMDWGGGDLEDLESASEYMKSLPHVDGTRMGIWGSSYGGTLTVYSLFRKPGLFKAGVAGAPAVDPRYFGSDDVAIVRRPQTHPDAFKRGAAQWAGNLRDHLLIIHGMEDDVVPFQTTVQLAEELMRLGKDFDVAFAPAATHGWTQRPHYARYLLQKLVDHFNRYLKGAP